jgi:hypothetical protein
VTEFWYRNDDETNPRTKTKELSTKAEARRLMKAKIEAKVEEGFEDVASRRAQQKDAQRALRERIASVRASMKASLSAGAKAKAKAKRRLPGPTSSTAETAPQKYTTSLPQLPPSYLDHVHSQGTDGEFERRVDPGKRRSPKLPGYPNRLVLHPLDRLPKLRKTFRSGLIPAADLTHPRDHRDLIPFGDDTQRTWMCWDPNARSSNGEMMICFIDGQLMDERTNAGYGLQKVLKSYRWTPPTR